MRDWNQYPLKIPKFISKGTITVSPVTCDCYFFGGFGSLSGPGGTGLRMFPVRWRSRICLLGPLGKGRNKRF